MKVCVCGGGKQMSLSFGDCTMATNQEREEEHGRHLANGATSLFEERHEKCEARTQHKQNQQHNALQVTVSRRWGGENNAGWVSWARIFGRVC